MGNKQSKRNASAKATTPAGAFDASQTDIVNKLKADLQNKRRENDENINTIYHQSQTIKSKKAKEEQLQAENNQLLQKVTDLQTNLEKSNKELIEEKSKIKDIRQKDNIDYKSQIEELNNVINSLRNLSTTTSKKHADEIHEMKEAHAYEIDVMQHSRLTEKRKFEEKIDQMNASFEATTREAESKIKKLTRENAKLSDLNQLCSIKDVITADGIMKYKDLNGKVLMVKKLEHRGNWRADGTVVSFERANFQICVHNELVLNCVTPLIMFDHVFCSTITKLCLVDTPPLTFDEYKNIVGSFKSLSLQRIIVKNQNGMDLNVVDLLKEVPNVETFEYTFKEKEAFPTKQFDQLQKFSHLQNFKLSKVLEDFDLKVFAEFIKKNHGAAFDIELRCSPKFYEEVENVRKNIIDPTMKLKLIKL